MKNLFFIIVSSTLASCMTNYPLTTFYVKNNSAKTINFKASIIKQSTMGAFDMTLPFTVFPNDSVVARRANFKKNISPTEWFTQFIIFPVDSVSLNNPKDPNNWIKSTDTKGNIVYTFNITKL
jgi:hypothetical protein